ncbi:acyl-CoA dehydrogenase [Jatrophihabitans sp. DSM 45814]
MSPAKPRSGAPAAPLGAGAALGQRLRELVAADADRIPLPGRGHTIQRWRALAGVAAEDVALIKLYEGHTDALSILAEVDPDAATALDVAEFQMANRRAGRTVWATWAAEPPSARLLLHRGADGIRLDGRKAWCSGAGLVDRAVVTAWDDRGEQCLATVTLDQPGVRITDEGWHAVGMGRSESVDVVFDNAHAVQLGQPGQYTARPGFWHGGAGIAACWYGAAIPFVEALSDLVARRGEPHAAAHLGAVSTSVAATRALLVESAAWIDANPLQDAQEIAMRARSAAEQTALVVIERAGRALGAGPLCRDESLARRFADLPVFLRQSHAEQDLAALGCLTATNHSASQSGWSL